MSGVPSNPQVTEDEGEKSGVLLNLHFCCIFDPQFLSFNLKVGLNAEEFCLFECAPPIFFILGLHINWDLVRKKIHSMYFRYEEFHTGIKDLYVEQAIQFVSP